MVFRACAREEESLKTSGVCKISHHIYILLLHNNKCMVDRDDIRDAQSRQADSHERALQELGQLGNLINDLEDAAPEDDVDLSWVRDFYEENAENYDTISQFAEDLRTEIEDRADDNSDVYLSVVDGYGIDNDRRNLLGIVAGSTILGGSGIISALILNEDDNTSSKTPASTNTPQTKEGAVNYTVPEANLDETAELADYFFEERGMEDFPAPEPLNEDYSDGSGAQYQEMLVRFKPGDAESDSKVIAKVGQGGPSQTLRSTVHDKVAQSIVDLNRKLGDGVVKNTEQYVERYLEPNQ